jgi:TetR/AcrR family transcriptional regulator, transcriptional repressor for nem operon
LKVPRPRKIDPEAVIEKTMQHFWRHGYLETSMPDLVAATGVLNGSLYHTFPGGKRDLFLESLDRYSRLVVPQKLGALETASASLGDVRAYFDGLVRDLVTPEGQMMGCLIVNSTVELASSDPDVARIVRAHMVRLERNMTRALRNAKRLGQISEQVNPLSKATQLMTTAIGLIVVAKTNPGTKSLKSTVEMAFAGLK